MAKQKNPKLKLVNPQESFEIIREGKPIKLTNKDELLRGDVVTLDFGKDHLKTVYLGIHTDHGKTAMARFISRNPINPSKGVIYFDVINYGYYIRGTQLYGQFAENPIDHQIDECGCANIADVVLKDRGL